MGKKIVQRIYICRECNTTPNDGDSMWEMGSRGVICENCLMNDELDDDHPSGFGKIGSVVYL